MKLTPYLKMLKVGKEIKQAILAPMRAAQGKTAAQLEMHKLDEKIATKEQEVAEICSEHPISFEELLTALDEIAWNERRKKQIGKIIVELFETEETEADAAQ